MEKPNRFTIHDKRDGSWLEQNYEPGAYYYDNPNFDVWVDTRHEAKSRLYQYLERKKRNVIDWDNLTQRNNS